MRHEEKVMGNNNTYNLSVTAEDGSNAARLLLESAEYLDADIDRFGGLEEQSRYNFSLTIDPPPSVEDIQSLADLIHNKVCVVNHTDGCGYFYESWENPGYARNYYYDRAQEMLGKVPLRWAKSVLNALRR